MKKQCEYSPVEEGLYGVIPQVSDLLGPERPHIGLDATRANGDERESKEKVDLTSFLKFKSEDFMKI